jgi:hypothetical protein
LHCFFAGVASEAASTKTNFVVSEVRRVIREDITTKIVILSSSSLALDLMEAQWEPTYDVRWKRTAGGNTTTHHEMSVPARFIKERGSAFPLSINGSDNFFKTGDHVDLQPMTKSPTTGEDQRSARFYQGTITRRYNSDGSASGGGSAAADSLSVGFVRVDGSAGDAHQRGRVITMFDRDPSVQVCLLSLRAAGVGLNLTMANVVMLLVSGLRV